MTWSPSSGPTDTRLLGIRPALSAYRRTRHDVHLGVSGVPACRIAVATWTSKLPKARFWICLSGTSISRRRQPLLWRCLALKQVAHAFEQLEILDDKKQSAA